MMTDVMEQTTSRVSTGAKSRPAVRTGGQATSVTANRHTGEAPEDVMTIRDMCDAFDVTPRTLRFYEAKELLFPVRQGTKRLFTRRDRARLTLILRGKRFGFSLEEIRQLLDMYDMGDQGGAQLARTYALATKHLAEMEAQRDELAQAITELKSQMEWGAAEMARLGVQ